MIKEAPHINFTPTTETIKKIEKIEEEETSNSDFIPENLAYVLGDLRFLKNREEFIKSPKEYKRRAIEAFKDLQNFIISSGGQEVKDVNEIYKKYQKSNSELLIVRREDPEKLMALLNNVNINLSFDPKVVGERGNKYANCAIWPYGKNAVAGIKNAFLEGRGMAGPIVSLMAVKQQSNNIKIEKPENSLLEVGDITREAVRIASGIIEKKNLEFIIIRIQKEYFPEEQLNESEKTNEKIQQIFRAFSF
jgi:hypothetical protein